MLPFALSSLLTRHRSPRRRAPRAQEPADMGTTLGMEQWLDERDHRLGQLANQANQANPATPATAVTAAPPSAQPRWLPRWWRSPRQLRLRP